MTKIYPIIPLNGEMYMVDNNYPIGGKYVALSERNGPQFGEIREFKNHHINGSWNTNWYYPKVPIGTFHIVATTDKKLGLPLLPSIEEVISYRGFNEAWNGVLSTIQNTWTRHAIFQFTNKVKDVWKAGYKAGSKKQYTDKDIWFVLHEVLGRGLNMVDDSTQILEIIQSLKPIPTAVEVETDEEVWTGQGSEITENKNFGKPLVDKQGFIIFKRWIYE